MNGARLRDKVLAILESEPDTRNSDILLTHRIWQRFHDVGEIVTLKEMYSLPREDNVKRIRAKIQNDEKMYVPTSWKIARARKFKESEWRDLLGYLPEGKLAEHTVKVEKELDKLFEVAVAPGRRHND